MLNDSDHNDVIVASDASDEHKELTDVTIDDLPYVVFEYILSHLSPYKELIDCKLVSRSWRSSVIGI